MRPETLPAGDIPDYPGGGDGKSRRSRPPETDDPRPLSDARPPWAAVGTALSKLARLVTDRFPGLDGNAALANALILVACAWMCVFIVFPLVQLLSGSFTDPAGHWVGIENFIRYFRTPALFQSLLNSLSVSLATTAVSVTTGFAFAYGLTRTRMPGKEVFRALAMAPLFAPTLFNGIVLVYLFGRKGLVTTGLFGAIEAATGIPFHFDIGVYGFTGIVLSEIIFTFPQAVLILSVALANTDMRLYEAAESLGASKLRTFLSVTLPGARYGLMSAAFVCFILTFTDFGAPKVVGGNYNVLATDIYKQVIGQQNFVMGATVSVILLMPTALAFLVERLCQGRQAGMVASGAVPYRPRKNPWRDRSFLALALAASGLLLVFFGTGLFASLAKVWPYDLTPDLRHYRFGQVGGGGYGAFLNSIVMSAWSAVIGTVLTFTIAHLVEKTPALRFFRRSAHALSMIPLALPGLVIGLAYIFFFNHPGWDVPGTGLHVPNPFQSIYGTMAILVMSNIVHFHTVGFMTALTALKQLDREFEAVSESLGVPLHRTFFRVTAPVCLPAICEMGLYYFVNSMATVSAVIFLYSADLPLASVAIANMDDAGDTASAAAMSILIVLVNLGVRGLYALLSRGPLARTRAWSQPTP